MNQKDQSLIIAQKYTQSTITIIKELIENSIDANSSDIKIYVSSNEIKVEDDGDGIDDLCMIGDVGVTSKYKYSGIYDDKSNDNKSNDNKSNNYKSNDNKSNDNKSNNYKSNDNKSNDNKSNNYKSNDDKSNNYKSNDDKSNDDKSNDNYNNISINNNIFINSNSTDDIDFKNNKVKTLGFRGMALFCIKEISDLLITSKSLKNKNALTKNFQTNQIFKSTRDRGTTVVVQNIFKNCPVRRRIHERCFKIKSDNKYDFNNDNDKYDNKNFNNNNINNNFNNNFNNKNYSLIPEILKLIRNYLIINKISITFFNDKKLIFSQRSLGFPFFLSYNYKSYFNIKYKSDYKEIDYKEIDYKNYFELLPTDNYFILNNSSYLFLISKKKIKSSDYQLIYLNSRPLSSSIIKKIILKSFSMFSNEFPFYVLIFKNEDQFKLSFDKLEIDFKDDGFLDQHEHVYLREIKDFVERSFSNVINCRCHLKECINKKDSIDNKKDSIDNKYDSIDNKSECINFEDNRININKISYSDSSLYKVEKGPSAFLNYSLPSFENRKLIDKINNSEINTSEINTSKINNSEINNSEINNSEINNSEINVNQILTNKMNKRVKINLKHKNYCGEENEILNRSPIKSLTGFKFSDKDYNNKEYNNKDDNKSDNKDANKDDNNKNYNNKDYNNKNYNNKDDNKSDNKIDNKDYNNKNYNNKNYNNKEYNNKDYNNKEYNNKEYNNKKYNNKEYNNKDELLYSDPINSDFLNSDIFNDDLTSHNDDLFSHNDDLFLKYISHKPLLNHDILIEKQDFKKMKVIGQFNDGFILCLLKKKIDNCYYIKNQCINNNNSQEINNDYINNNNIQEINNNNINSQEINNDYINNNNNLCINNDYINSTINSQEIKNDYINSTINSQGINNNYINNNNNQEINNNNINSQEINNDYINNNNIQEINNDYDLSEDHEYNFLIIIDQHAADEIKNFENLQNEFYLKKQKLIIPKKLELNVIDEYILRGNLKTINRNGFEVEERIERIGSYFEIINNKNKNKENIDEDINKDINKDIKSKDIINNDHIIDIDIKSDIDKYTNDNQKLKSNEKYKTSLFLTAVPIYKNRIFDLSDLLELIDLLKKEKMSFCTKFKELMASKACRTSIMIGDRLNLKEMEDVVKRLSQLKVPWCCPHGRPVFRVLCRL
ncbi:hypothetical protein DMUE_2107 [Dictyocoela muelleri]|nr:hypothetical protein DMUE_2107 [Dictyocoela muelleri]